jgi:HEAT repeat protein
MVSTFETFRKLGPAAFVLKAILVAAAADVLLLSFILLRRMYRKRYFARRDARAFAIRQKWAALVSGEIPYETWRSKALDRRIVEEIALDTFETSGPEQSARLLTFLRTSGLIEKRIFEARHHRGWRRLRALVALGRTRAPEGILALSEGLRDRALETQLAALRGLGRMACPEAAEEILHWLSEVGIVVPALPLQSALIQCSSERPQLLLPYLHHAEKTTREVLGRVLGEVATPSLAEDLLNFVDDDLPELRAAAARALSQAEPRFSLDVLRQLAEDSVWFVRLRAMVSLGKLCHPHAAPSLLRGLRDSHRLVRLRAAEALVDLKTEKVAIFEQVVSARDRYGLHAYLTALDNAGLQGELELELKETREVSIQVQQLLLDVLRTGSLPAEQIAPETAVAAAASRP